MMGINEQVEREEDSLWERHHNGELDDHGLAEELDYLHREARGAIEEEAQSAYDDVMNRY